MEEKNQNFQIGNLYMWYADPQLYRIDALFDSLCVWGPNRTDIWTENFQSELNPKSVVMVLECHKELYYTDLKIISTTGTYGWIRIEKAFFKSWHEVSP